MFSPIISIKENNIVSATKAIIETKVVTRSYKNYPERTIKRPQ